MNTDTWYANHKNYTPSMAAWYEEHKSYGGPEMNTETWYANHKNYTGMSERGDMVRAVLLWQVVRSIEEHRLLKELRAADETPAPKALVGKAHSKSKSQVKQQHLAASSVERFNLGHWLEKPHTDFLSLASNINAKTGKAKMTQEVSDYLDSKTSLDLDTWLAREAGGSEHQAKDAERKASSSGVSSSGVLGKWLQRHASPNMGSWLQSFSRESSAFRAGANARLARAALDDNRKALHHDAQHSELSRSKLQSLQSADPNSPQFDFETWWAELGKNETAAEAVHVGNWTKLLPNAEAGAITATGSVGAGACCCGFACESISNECCGAWYAPGGLGGQPTFHYGSFKQNPKSVAALSARAKAAQEQQRTALQHLAGKAALQAQQARTQSLAQVAKPLNAKTATAAGPKAAAAHSSTTERKATSKVAQVKEPATHKVAQAFGDKHFLGWQCTTEACMSAPVRVGATCEVECLSTDGINCMQTTSCLEKAAATAQDADFVQCGSKMAKAVGTSGYDDPAHWCFCAKQKLAAQIASCRGGPDGGAATTVYADGMTFGSDMAFKSGESFGNNEVFGKGDTFGSDEKFGDSNVFGNRTVFGMANSFGNKNKFQEGTLFGSGARLGDYNTFGDKVVFRDNAVLGVGSRIAEGAKFGTDADLGKDTKIAQMAKLAANVKLGDGSVVGDKSVIGRGAVIGAKVKIGKAVSLTGVASMGAGTEIGAGSSLGGAGSALADSSGAAESPEADEGEEGAGDTEPEGEFYRPDPGSPYAREGNPEMEMRLDGHNHWPIYIAEDDAGDADAGDGEAEGAEEEEAAE